jgi:PAS domain S-box-containing protein
MTRPLRILILEDSPIDTELNIRELQKSGFVFSWDRVETETEFLAALKNKPDVILADYNLPHFDGLRALAHVRKNDLDIPFILISGVAGEDLAVAAMRAGANDYLLKKSLARLGPAIERELREYEIRGQRKQAIFALSESEKKFRKLVETLQEGIWAIDEQKHTTYVNPPMAAMLGYNPEEMLGRHMFSFMDEQEIEIAKLFFQSQMNGHKKQHEFKLIKKDCSRLFVSMTIGSIIDDHHKYTGAIAGVVDITERKAAEEEIRRHAAHAEALVQTAFRLNERLNEEIVLKKVCEQVSKVLNIPFAYVLMPEEQDKSLDVAAFFGFPEEFISRYQPPSRDVYDRFVSQFGDSGIISDIQTISGLVNSKIYTEMDIHSAMLVGMFHSQQLTGILVVFTTDEQRKFTRDELSLLKGLAAQAAQAVDNARLFEKVSSGEKQSRALSGALMELQEIERRSLALELHDELGQLLSSTKMSLELIPSLNETAGLEQLERAQGLISDLVQRVRRMALDLRPSMLDDMGLIPALNWLCKDYQIRTGEPVEIKQTGLDRRFPPQLEIAVFRIIQEALTNVIRHAGNKRVIIRAWTDEQSINLQITDYGVGFDPVVVLSEHVSSGLSGMSERARLLGGELLIESYPGAGTTLTTRLPLNTIMEAIL